MARSWPFSIGATGSYSARLAPELLARQFRAFDDIAVFLPVGVGVAAHSAVCAGDYVFFADDVRIRDDAVGYYLGMLHHIGCVVDDARPSRRT